jgi:hypothetical protein
MANKNPLFSKLLKALPPQTEESLTGKLCLIRKYCTEKFQ